MASTASTEYFGHVKLEHSPDPNPPFTIFEPSLYYTDITTSPDSKDPEDFLKRCSGLNKKTKSRCSAVIGKKMQQNTHPTYLPTCSAHRDQQSTAGWCQYTHSSGERCSRLFRWTPPYFELCAKHQGHPDMPCYFLKLPLELRHEVFRYLLPTQPIGSSTAAIHDSQDERFDYSFVHAGPLAGNPYAMRVAGSTGMPPPRPSQMLAPSVFPMRLLDLLRVNRQVCGEVRDLLFSIASFTIDIRKDGAYMCGRRLLEPRRPDGSSHYLADEVEEAKQKFLDRFNWAAVKNYTVDILLENGSDMRYCMMPIHPSHWDEEVEIYDIRDYVSVVISGILAKSSNLCKLSVRLCLADFEHWPEEQILATTKLITAPFERLRNVRQPQLTGVYIGRQDHNTMLSVKRPKRHSPKRPLCSVPKLPTTHPILTPLSPSFATYASSWTSLLCTPSPHPITPRAPIKAMFTTFKDFYTHLSTSVHEITARSGRHAFLHRARVAREQEDVEAFRHLRNELIQVWYMHLDREERTKREMGERLARMLEGDCYPASEWQEEEEEEGRHVYSGAAQQCQGGMSCASGSSDVLLNADKMVHEGIPMTGNLDPSKQAGAHVADGLVRCGTAALSATYGMVPAMASRRDAAARAQRDLHRKLDRQELSQGRERARRRMAQKQMASSSPAVAAQQLSPTTVSSTDCTNYYVAFDSTTRTYVDVDAAGPSTKRRRVDSGAREEVLDSSTSEEIKTNGVTHTTMNESDHDEEKYTGKGKGRLGMGMETKNRYVRLCK